MFGEKLELQAAPPVFGLLHIHHYVVSLLVGYCVELAWPLPVLCWPGALVWRWHVGPGSIRKLRVLVSACARMDLGEIARTWVSVGVLST